VAVLITLIYSFPFARQVSANNKYFDKWFGERFSPKNYCQNNSSNQGPKGEKGDTGLQGPAGPFGPQGIQGIPGLPGEIGLTGPQGQPGIQGIQGIDGKNGQDGAQGPVGPIGPKGDKGDKGEKGDVGEPSMTPITGYEIVLSAITPDDNLAKDITATCTSGKKVIGGGFNSLNVSDANEVVIKSSYPNTESSWRVMGNIDASGTSTTFSLQAYAICINAD
jgi:hypothetical protein